MSILLEIASLSTVLILYRLWIQWRNQSYHLPPGPKGLPYLGNIYDVPKEESWLAYQKMSKDYNSDIIYLNMAGMSVLVLNSRKAVDDLLVERSSLYSGCLHMAMIDLIGWSWNIGFIPYGEKWRKLRSLFIRLVQPSALRAHINPCIQRCACDLLYRLLESPEHFVDYSRLLAGDAILRPAYGIRVTSKDDYFIRLAERGSSSMSAAGIHGAYMVDYFPLLRYIPAWFPRAEFKRMAERERKITQQMLTFPMEFAKRGMADRTAVSSIVSRYLQEMQDSGTWTSERKTQLAQAVGVMYAAGADTTFSVIESFFLAVVQNPDILQSGRKAVDAVIGVDRLPSLDDEGTIPYVDALVRECLRWHPVTPLSIPHYIATADVYNGYYIPPKTTIVGNAWALLRDETVYRPDVDKFRPERFLNADDGTLSTIVPYPDAAFGFGRRVCAGKRIAESVVWIAVASLLACFDIKEVQGASPEGRFHGNMLRHADRFQCEIRVRSPEVEALIRANVVREDEK